MIASDHRVLPSSAWRTIQRDYRRKWGLTPRRLTPEGLSEDPASDPLGRIPAVMEARRRAVSESLRWGGPSVFLLADGMVSWVVALEQSNTLRGGVCGGEITVADAAGNVTESVLHLASSHDAILRYLAQLPVWDQEDVSAAARDLETLTYAVTGWTPSRMRRHRADAQQQREIAEAIHHGKLSGRHGWQRNEERQLLQLIRIGDLTGARRILNRLLAGMFLDTPALPVLQARILELLGYLVRVAIEDAPECTVLMRSHHAWIVRIMQTVDFESVCITVRDALDDFMTQVSTQGAHRNATQVRQALALAESVLPRVLSLNEAAQAVGLSRFRLAHRVKDTCGLSFGRMVARMRIERACQQLKTTTRNCAEIAAELEFTDQSHFTRVFRSVTGTTPARYRRGEPLPKPHAADTP